MRNNNLFNEQTQIFICHFQHSTCFMLQILNLSLITHTRKSLCLCFTRVLVDDADEAVITSDSAPGSDCHLDFSDPEESALPSV
jgi:hypothetical protein